MHIGYIDPIQPQSYQLHGTDVIWLYVTIVGFLRKEESACIVGNSTRLSNLCQEKKSFKLISRPHFEFQNFTIPM